MRIETVGKVQPHVKAKIVDSEGQTLPVNMPGELHVSGYLLQQGYVFLVSLQNNMLTGVFLQLLARSDTN